jgi:formate hydrogenlyase subunit 6/NADH:ubiquinone oxidoreductase subunit I
LTSILKSLALTVKHFGRAGKGRNTQQVQDKGYFAKAQGNGITTLPYPFQELDVPANGRYKLDNAIEDCIVCDKCARVCPVDCIAIEPIRSATEIGKASDGSSIRLYAARFDIDMSKCCYCGLCTTVCPTACLTMTPEYDFSVTELGKLNFGFGNMSVGEIELRKAEWDTAQAEKAAKKAN